MGTFQEILEAINAVRAKIRWKAGSAMHHLRKRKSRGHLPSDATLDDYEEIILKVLNDKSSQVYRYWYNRVPYVTVITAIHDIQWLVMFNYDGIMETCFVIERQQRYLAKPGFEWIGQLGKVDNEL